MVSRFCWALLARTRTPAAFKTVLTSQNVRTDVIITASDRPTTTKTRIVSGQQQIVRIDREVKKPVSGALAEEVLATFTAALETADACILSDYAKGLLTPSICHQMVARARKRGKTVVVDPKGTDFSKYAGCTVMTPNLHEAGIAANVSIESDADLSIAADRLRAILGPDSALLVTLGADGMTLFRNGQSVIHIAALAHEVFDVTGAGDTVSSTLTLALACGAFINEAILLSNLAASIVVQKIGTATVSPEDFYGVAIKRRPSSYKGQKLRPGGPVLSCCSESNAINVTPKLLFLGAIARRSGKLLGLWPAGMR